MSEKYYMKLIITRNLTPLAPLTYEGMGVSKPLQYKIYSFSLPCRGEVWRGVDLYTKNLSDILL
jgi:hypothetical protein